MRSHRRPALVHDGLHRNQSLAIDHLADPTVVDQRVRHHKKVLVDGPIHRYDRQSADCLSPPVADNLGFQGTQKLAACVNQGLDLDLAVRNRHRPPIDIALKSTNVSSLVGPQLRYIC